jgi:hypothetical protein
VDALADGVRRAATDGAAVDLDEGHDAAAVLLRNTSLAA